MSGSESGGGSGQGGASGGGGASGEGAGGGGHGAQHGGSGATGTPASRTVHATVDQLEADVAVLDVEGEPLRVPRAWLPGEVREGAGFAVTFSASPQTARALKESVEARLRALMGQSGAGTAGGGDTSGGPPNAGGQGSGAPR